MLLHALVFFHTFIAELTLNECTNGDVRLVNGKKDNEGRAQYCYKGKWSPMCYLSTYTAILFCKKLGYTDYKCKVIKMMEMFLMLKGQCS